MKIADGVPDRGIWCMSCKRYWWYDEIKKEKCPKGHDVGE